MSQQSDDRDVLDRLARLEERVGQHFDSISRRMAVVENVLMGLAGAIILAVLAAVMSVVLK